MGRLGREIRSPCILMHFLMLARLEGAGMSIFGSVGPFSFSGETFTPIDTFRGDIFREDFHSDCRAAGHFRFWPCWSVLELLFPEGAVMLPGFRGIFG